jgi:hypothetical protein
MRIKAWAVIANSGGEVDVETFADKASATARAWEGIEELFMEQRGEDESFEDFKNENDNDLNTAWVALCSPSDTLHVNPIEVDVPSHSAKIWTLTTDTVDGLQTQLFTTEAARDAAVFDWLSIRDSEDRSAQEISDQFNGDMVLAGEAIQNGEDFLNFDDHLIETPFPEFELRSFVDDGEGNVTSAAILDRGHAANCGLGLYTRAEPDASGIKELVHVVDFPAPHVKIEVSGGVAEVTECPDGVEVTIQDHDNERNG